MNQHGSTSFYPIRSEVLQPRSSIGIINTLDRLQLPYYKYFVIGGANLVLREVIETTPDIDILVSDELFDDLTSMDGAKLKSPPARALVRGATNMTVWLQRSPLDVPLSATTHLGDGYYPMQFATHQERTEIVKGIPCVDLECVTDAKLALQRPQDLDHLHAIARFTGRIIDLPEPTIVNPVPYS